MAWPGFAIFLAAAGLIVLLVISMKSTSRTPPGLGTKVRIDRSGFIVGIGHEHGDGLITIDQEIEDVLAALDFYGACRDDPWLWKGCHQANDVVRGNVDIVKCCRPMRWSGLFRQLFDQLSLNPAAVVSCGYVVNALALSIISTAPAPPAKTSVGVR